MELTDAEKSTGAIAASLAAAGWLFRRFMGVLDSKATRAELELVNLSLKSIHDKLDRYDELGERVARLEGERQ